MIIEIKTIPQHQMRDPNGIGDYWWSADGALYITVAEMADERYEQLVALHELIEAILCQARGISETKIMKFDLENPDLDDPGMDPRAPYVCEHQTATGFELLMADQLGVIWMEYDEAVKDAIARGKAARSVTPQEDAEQDLG